MAGRLCSRCRSVRDSGFAMCLNCTLYRREFYARQSAARRAAGLCVQCDGPNGGRFRCAGCREGVARQKRELLARRRAAA